MGELARVEEVDAGVFRRVDCLEDAGTATGADGNLADGGYVDTGPNGDLHVFDVERSLDPGNGLGKRDGLLELDDAAHADAGCIVLVRDDDLAAGLDAAGADPVGEPVVDAASGGVNCGMG